MPRHAYIEKKESPAESKIGTCRGGVGSQGSCDCGIDDGWSLEIGSMMNCCPEMLAVAAHVDEIKSLLEAIQKREPLAKMVNDSLKKQTAELVEGLKA